MTDAYHSVKKSSKDKHVGPGLGLPLLLGIWIDPMPGLYVYMMAEPSWSFWGGDRKTTPFIPFNCAGVHIRIAYTSYKVDPYSWHIISVGFGYSSKAMAELGKAKITKK